MRTGTDRPSCHQLALVVGALTALSLYALALNISSARGQTTDPVIVAAGDIACDPGDPAYNGGDGTVDKCHMKATSDLVVNADPDAVLTLGDEQYSDGALSKFQQSYDPTWGRFKAITKPAVGNHEYSTAGASGYFDYFGAAAGDPSKGYYSYELGSWHLIALNSNCDEVGGCEAGSAQENWLAADLAAHPAACTLAYDHHPRFSSGVHGGTAALGDLYRDLYNAGADVFLSGHDHDYERFLPQDPNGAPDDIHGIRQFVVGTGGKDLRSFSIIDLNSEARNSDSFGVLELSLHDAGYDWDFIPELGKTFTDSGGESCRDAPPTPAPPPLTLKLKPRHAKPGQTVGFTGSGFPPSTPLYLVWNPTCPGPDKSGGFPLASLKADGSGAVSGALTVPRGPGIPAYRHRIRLTDDPDYTSGCTGGTAFADQSFDIDARIESPGAISWQVGEGFCLAASGFGVYETISFAWEPSTRNLDLGSTTMGGGGSRTFCSLIPEDTYGYHPVRATGGGGTPETPTIQMFVKPTLRISSQAFRPTTTVKWHAMGLSGPTCAVTLTDQTAGGLILDSAPSTDDRGSVHRSFVVPKLSPGTHRWKATDCNLRGHDLLVTIR
jgi:calcineurin-like phosphoesterase family protein